LPRRSSPCCTAGSWCWKCSWETKPHGQRVFRLSEEPAQATKALAANQGLSHGFLAAGLAWALALGADGHAIRIFFLGCVVVAGAFGAATAGRKIR